MLANFRGERELLAIRQYAWTDVNVSDDDEPQEPTIPDEAWIKLAATSGTTVQPDDVLNIQISWFAPEGNASQILITHGIGMWGFDTITDLNEAERTSGTRNVTFKNPLGNLECEVEKTMVAELYPGGWAVTPRLAKSNAITPIIYLCDR